jgi:uncharacterized peroxidase-related enzyme
MPQQFAAQPSKETTMSRLHTAPVTDATGPAADLFAAIAKAAGKVPNAYAAVGSNSPLALESVLKLDATLAKSSLSKKEIETIKLAVSEANGCDYCVAAHSLLGRKAGLSDADLLAIRRGDATADERLDVLASFARGLVTTRGTVPAETVRAVQAAGFTDGQIVDAMLAITAISFTNLFNRVNDTAVDFPVPAAI